MKKLLTFLILACLTLGCSGDDTTVTINGRWYMMHYIHPEDGAYELTPGQVIWIINGSKLTVVNTLSGYNVMALPSGQYDVHLGKSSIVVEAYGFKMFFNYRVEEGWLGLSQYGLPVEYPVEMDFNKFDE